MKIILMTAVVAALAMSGAALAGDTPYPQEASDIGGHNDPGQIGAGTSN